MAAAFSNRVCEEKSVIKIFYDNDWGWRLISELSALVLYITALSVYVKSRWDFPSAFYKPFMIMSQYITNENVPDMWYPIFL